MKACVIQPPYSYDLGMSDEYFAYKLKMLKECDETMDIIVLPEYSDVPCVTSTLEETLFYHEKYMDSLLDTCKETAQRCDALVFVNALSKEERGYRNTTFAIDPKGEIVGKYFKKHLPPLELYTLKLDSEYTFEYSKPYVLEIDGLRYGFLTCYDFYFYESFANIARENVDIIIGCSLQRSDSHDAIETMCRFLAYNTNAYVLRSSVSFAEDSEICGASMIVSPEGKVLENMKGRFGKATAEFDPQKKYYKPAGFGNPDAPHYKYIEFGRKPWQYRPGGSAIVCPDDRMSYPRICVQREVQSVTSENTMAFFGAAIALGAEEIRFDIRTSEDRRLVVCQDEVLFEDVLKKFSCHAVMNIHLNTTSETYDEDIMRQMIDLIHQYDCEKYVYFTISHDEVIKQFKAYAPDVPICVGPYNNDEKSTVDRAIALGAQKAELAKESVHVDLIKKSHAHGIICNLSGVNDVEESKGFFGMGIDTILTNDYLLISKTIKHN